MRLRLVSILLPLLALSCGKGDDSAEEATATPIDCTWFEGDNCWKESVALAAECAGPKSEFGIFNADRTVCSYSDGTEVRFATPAPMDIMKDYTWDFEIFKAGSSCMSFSSDDTGLVLGTSDGTFSEGAEGYDMIMECPDGARYSIGAFDAMECDWSQLPGYSTSGYKGSISFSFMGSSKGYFIFECQSEK